MGVRKFANGTVLVGRLNVGPQVGPQALICSRLSCLCNLDWVSVSLQLFAMHKSKECRLCYHGVSSSISSVNTSPWKFKYII